MKRRHQKVTLFLTERRARVARKCLGVGFQQLDLSKTARLELGRLINELDHQLVIQEMIRQRRKA